MNWADALKVAIATKNSKEIQRLAETLPQFENIAQMQEASYLLKEASTVMSELKDETLLQIRQIKKNIEFLQATHQNSSNKLDVMM